MLLGLAHGIGHRRTVTHVAGQGQDVVAQVRQTLGQRRLVEIDRHHLGAFGDKSTHDGLAHALRGTGHERHFIE